MAIRVGWGWGGPAMWIIFNNSITKSLMRESVSPICDAFLSMDGLGEIWSSAKTTLAIQIRQTKKRLFGLPNLTGLKG